MNNHTHGYQGAVKGISKGLARPMSVSDTIKFTYSQIMYIPTRNRRFMVEGKLLLLVSTVLGWYIVLDIPEYFVPEAETQIRCTP